MVIMDSLETSKNSISLENNEIKECPVCKKGQMLPSDPKAKVNYCYVCNNCGTLWNIDPAGVIVE